jgi:hypothetical protein
MTFLFDALRRWEEGPYAMKAIIGCEFEDKPGSWFVQLRTPAIDVMDQVVLATVTAPERETALEKARLAAGVTEIVPWPRRKHPASTIRLPGLLAALVRCEHAMAMLSEHINTLHDEI